jgi:hypothetical protein
MDRTNQRLNKLNAHKAKMETSRALMA